MAICGDLKLCTSFTSHSNHPLRPSLSSSKPCFGRLFTGGSHDLGIITLRQSPVKLQGLAAKGDKPSSTAINQDAEGFLLKSIDKGFFERLSLAWRILFPTTTTENANARVAKQRLKMILYSDRCVVSDEAKQKIVSSIVNVLSDFVEIESQDKVQLSVSTDPALGTVYSVIVPVRCVKPEYHESHEDYTGKIASIEYKDTGETSGSVDVKFNFFVPNEK